MGTLSPLQFSKSYDGMEHRKRFAVFKNNTDLISKHNKLYDQGKESFYMSVNQFADLTSTEFAQKMNGYRSDLKYEGRETNLGKKCPHRSIRVVPDSVDWRLQGSVTDVASQGVCGSCWSFSTTGAVEGAWHVSGHPLIKLSDEELVECDRSGGCHFPFSPSHLHTDQCDTMVV